MAVRIPEEDELRSRITEHLQARPNNPIVSAVWQGYIAGLLEWGVIDPHMHSRLVDLLPAATGRAETGEILAGLEYVDAHPEFKSAS